jgi:hypothetical protein
MKKALMVLAVSLISFAAHAEVPPNMKPLFPINTKPANVASTTAEQEKADMGAEYYYSNLCCIGYGYYCYLPGYYPIGYNCYCYSRGYYYRGWVCGY